MTSGTCISTTRDPATKSVLNMQFISASCGPLHSKVSSEPGNKGKGIPGYKGKENRAINGRKTGDNERVIQGRGKPR